MRIGVDLDNTIVCYDGLFHRVALRLGWLTDDCATDKQAGSVAQRPISPQDLGATILHVLGIDHRTVFHTPLGRPVPLVDGGKPIHELV